MGGMGCGHGMGSAMGGREGGCRWVGARMGDGWGERGANVRAMGSADGAVGVEGGVVLVRLGCVSTEIRGRSDTRFFRSILLGVWYP